MLNYSGELSVTSRVKMGAGALQQRGAVTTEEWSERGKAAVFENGGRRPLGKEDDVP